MGLTRANVFPSKYLGKDDVAKPIRLDIADVRMETIKGEHGDEEKAVMYWSDSSTKAMIVNATNWDTLEEAYGPDTDQWTGKKIEVYIDPGVSYAGRRVGGVRLRIPAGASSAPTSVSSTMTWADAIAYAGGKGMTKEALVAALKARGLAGYNPERDTATVRQIVSEFADHAPVAEDDNIPF